jgi:hypothetical protein
MKLVNLFETSSATNAQDLATILKEYGFEAHSSKGVVIISRDSMISQIGGDEEESYQKTLQFAQSHLAPGLRAMWMLKDDDNYFLQIHKNK